MKRLITFLMALLLTWIGANAQIANGSYMVVNTETGQFLYGSYNWGSRASLGSKPVFFTVTSTGENTYTLSSQQWTDTKYLYLSGTDFYCDTGTSTNITVTETETGSGIYTISSGTNYMLQEGKNAGTTTTTDVNSASHWQFVSLQDVIDSMEDASSSNPVDVTALIDDANFKPGGNGLTAKNSWTTSGVTIGNYSSNATQACCAEGYNETSFSVNQSITLPKAGYYNLSAQGFYRNGSDGTGTNNVSAQMYFGEETVNLDARRTSANTMAAAWEVFLEGSEPVSSITYHVTSEEGEEVEIGFTGAVPNNSWAIFGELQLEYLGETLEYAIGEPECTTAYVQPGGELTITFPNCVTPNTNEEPVLDTSKSITVNGENVTDAVLTSTGLTSTVTFTVPTTLAQGAEVTVVVPAGLVTWSGTEVSSPAQDVTFTLHTPAMADQMGVYLLNCHIDEFISRGYAWGTEADADQYGIPVDIIADEDGLYTIQFVDNSLYLGDTGWAYTDCSGTNVMHYSIESYNDGTLTGYRFRCEEASTDEVDCYLYVNESGDFLIANNGHEGYIDTDGPNYTDVAQTVWQILSMEERDAHKEAFVASQKAAIAEIVGATDLDTYIDAQPVTDVTDLVTNPDFTSVATSGTSGWVASSTNTSGNNATASADSNGLEVYNGCEQIQQTITGLEEGVYKIDLNGLYRQASNAVCWPYKDYDLSIAYIDANGYQINLASWGSEATYTDGSYSPNNTSQASTACETGYANELYTYVGSDGELVITITNPGHVGSEWMYVRKMSLTWYGELEDVDSDYHTGDVVTVDGTIYTVLGENEIENHSFELGFEGWTDASNDHNTITSSNFELRTDDPKTGDHYLVGTSWSGSSSAGSLCTAWEIKPATTYYFSYWVKNLNNQSETNYLVTSLTNEIGTETLTLGYPASVSSDWQLVEYTFTNGEEGTDYCYSYVQVKFRWLATEQGADNWGFDDFSLYEVEATGVEWEMTDAGWGTMILPFDAEIPTGLTAYAGDALELSSDGSTITVSDEDAATTIAANTPYLVKGDAKTYTFTGTPEEATTLTSGMLTGTYETLDCDALLEAAGSNTVYLLQNHDGEGLAFYPVVVTDSEGATLTPYHCYLTLSSDVNPTSLRLPGMATAIKAVESDVIAGDAIYDLSGRKVSKAVKGVYIQNGKKVLVK